MCDHCGRRLEPRRSELCHALPTDRARMPAAPRAGDAWLAGVPRLTRSPFDHPVDTPPRSTASSTKGLGKRFHYPLPGRKGVVIISSDHSKIRNALVALAVSAFVVTGAVAVVTTNFTTAAVAAVPVEDEGADCPVSRPGLTAHQRQAPRSVQEAGRHPHRHQGRLALPAGRDQGAGGEVRLRREARQARERHRDGLGYQHHRERERTRAGAPASRPASSCPAAPGRSRPSSSWADSARTPPPSGPPAPRSSTTTRYAVGRGGHPAQQQAGRVLQHLRRARAARGC